MRADLLRIKIQGHLTLAMMEEVFAPISRAFDEDREGGSHPLLIDVLDMTSYDVAARDWFVKTWSPNYRPRVTRLAIVTHKLTWRMLAATVALATGQRMKAFASMAEAEDWLAAG